MPKTASRKIQRSSRPRWMIAVPILLLIAVVALVYFLSRNSSFLTRQPTPTPTEVTQFSVDDAFVLFGVDGVTYLDVRPATAYKAYRIVNSVNIPAEELSSRMGELDKSKTIVIFDASGAQPAIDAQASLRGAGFKKAIWVRGGMEAWVQRRYPLVGTAPY